MISDNKVTYHEVDFLLPALNRHGFNRHLRVI